MGTTIAFAGHRFRVIALDGNPVVQPQTVDSLPLAPGERVDAVVEMNNPGVWIFGGTSANDRAAGMGVVVEYAGASGPPQWQNPPASTWDLTAFGRGGYAPLPDDAFELTFAKIPGGRGGYNRWTINGKSWPDTDPLLVRRGRRYRITLRNDSGDMHGIHLHRHLFELIAMDGEADAQRLQGRARAARPQNGHRPLRRGQPWPGALALSHARSPGFRIHDTGEVRNIRSVL